MNNLGKKIINKNNIIGNDIKYSDEYLELSEEINKLDALDFNKEINFNKIVDLSIDILENKSKDITVSIYLSIALSKTSYIVGFASSVQIIKDMLEQFGADLYPKNIIAKYNAFKWWIGKILSILNNTKDINIKLEETVYNNLFFNLKFIDTFLNTYLNEKINFNELFALLNTKLEKKEKKKEKKKEEKKEEKPLKNTSTLESYADEIISFQDIFNKLLKDLNNISCITIENDNFNIYLFLLNRIKIWFDIDKIPSNESGKTLIKAPENHEIEYLNTLYKEQSWDKLLIEAESRIFSYVFWLDLHFYVYVSLKHKQIQNIKTYITFIKDFINKFPQLISLKFDNGFNFANSATKLWLKDIILENKQTEKSQIDKDLQKGFELLGNNKIIKSMKFFLKQIKNASNKKDETFIIIELINILKDYKYNDLIYNYLDYLLETVDDYKLLEWEPNLTIKIYKLVINANKTLDYDISVSKLNEIKKNLSVLDLELYLNLTNE
jgi:type VI secretion system protein VasJ